jgi:hypothetical protein
MRKLIAVRRGEAVTQERQRDAAAVHHRDRHLEAFGAALRERGLRHLQRRFRGERAYGEGGGVGRGRRTGEHEARKGGAPDH